MKPKEFYVMTDASSDEKAQACQEVAQIILQYVQENGVEQKLLHALVTSCVTSIAIEMYTRDEISLDDRELVFRDSIDELSEILGLKMDMILAPAGGVN